MPGASAIKTTMKRNERRLKEEKEIVYVGWCRRRGGEGGGRTREFAQVPETMKSSNEIALEIEDFIGFCSLFFY